MTAGRKGIRRGLGIHRSIAKRHKYEERETIFLCGLCVLYGGELRIRASQSSGLDCLKDLAGSAFLMAGRPGNEAFSCLLQCFPHCHHFHVWPLAHLYFLLWGLARKCGQNPFWLFKTVSFPSTPYLSTRDFKNMKF